MLCDRIAKSHVWMVCLGLVLLAGRFPEDTLDWRDDALPGASKDGN